MLDRAWCSAVITAAGASSRMGSPKALVDYRGQPLLGHQLAALEGFGQRIVVLGSAAAAIRAALDLEAATVVENPDWRSGRSGSLRCGFGAVHDDARAMLVVGVDQPLDSDVIEALLGTFDPPSHAFAIPLVDGRRGHPIVFAAALLQALRELGDDETLRGLANSFAAAALEVPLDAPEALRNLNTPTDLEG